MGITRVGGILSSTLLILQNVAAIKYKMTVDSDCDCYLTNGSTGTYFKTHKFYDFRSRSDLVNVPSSYAADPDAASNADVASDYFNSDEWNDGWSIQQWNNSANLDDGDANVLMVNSPANVYFDANADPDAGSDTYLTLRTARLDEFQTAAEFESVAQAYHYASARMYARAVGPPGAVAAMFTYRGSDDPNAIQEADLEIRTMDPPDVIQYTNQPAYNRDGDPVDRATRNATVPVGWDRWAVHRMDWSPSSTMWYVDGDNVSQIAFQTPRDPSSVIFNMWSDGAHWSGNMSVGDEAYLQIQWIELVYNATDDTEASDNSGGGGGAKQTHSKRGGWLSSRDDEDNGGTCHKVCSIDDTDTLGTPVLLSGTPAVVSLGNAGYWLSLLTVAVVYSVF
ncbi:hypothetical protein E8E14_003681 [Neopestalotiopsis sp. 37M]|nr:hypothetical protein E8E14_003681 [Neopestalotiopsis sp. 37M]